MAGDISLSLCPLRSFFAPTSLWGSLEKDRVVSEVTGPIVSERLAPSADLESQHLFGITMGYLLFVYRA